MSVPNRIEKSIILRAPQSRVWQAISDAKQFGAWFGVAFEGAFAPGKAMVGQIVPTTVDPEVAKLQAPHAGQRFDITIDRMDAPRLFSFRWHPFAIEPGVDYSAEPTTLVTFELGEVDGGTKLVITETGFDGVPLARRIEAFRANEGGWEHQTRLLEKYLGSHAA